MRTDDYHLSLTIQQAENTMIPANVSPGFENRTEIVEVIEFRLHVGDDNAGATRMLWRSATFAAIRLEMRGSRQPISLRDYMKENS